MSETTSLRDRLKALDRSRYEQFLQVVEICAPILETIEDQFPNFTRHDPSHIRKLESNAARILTDQAADSLTGADLFVLLTSLWVHDVGMGDLPAIRREESERPKYQELLAVFRRKGDSNEACWRAYARENHHNFCPEFVRQYLSSLAISSFEQHWIGMIAKSHGEPVSDLVTWEKRVAVADEAYIRPILLAVLLRLADILHFNESRAPEYMLEHRQIRDAESVAHWRAHQAIADFVIEDRACVFHGVTNDDEAYWFAQQFFAAIDEELNDCLDVALPRVDSPFDRALAFSRVRNRIEVDGFISDEAPVRLDVDGPRLLTELLGKALYGGKPAWFRELIQNAFDACRDRRDLDPRATPEVRVRFDTREGVVEIEDTGLGMTGDVVRRFLLMAGASYWSSSEYEERRAEPIGHVGTFGIGFMSVFAAANEVVVTTRHHDDDQGLRFRIRSPSRIVRVERYEGPVGTIVRLILKDGEMSQLDAEALLLETCPFPEFPVSVSVDGVQISAIEGPASPTLSNGPELTRTSDGAVETRMLAEAFDEDGIDGTLHVAKLWFDALNAFIPDLRGWIRQAGWEWEGSSAAYFGGVKYPALHSIDGLPDYRLPNLGVFRVAISPDCYALEMNLAREKFVGGPEVERLMKVLCGTFDRIVADDIGSEVARTESPSLRASIFGTYSASMLHSWIGRSSSESPASVLRGISRQTARVAESPFPRLRRLAEQELQVGLIDVEGRLRNISIGDLCRAGAVVFGCGWFPVVGTISTDLAEAVREFDSDALLLVSLPEHKFGMPQLRHWACEEILIPIGTHGRSAYGLRFSEDSRPHSLRPTELDDLGVPIASGPEEYAVLDYRDMMAEAVGRTGGTSDIIAVLNRRNPVVGDLIQELSGLGDVSELQRMLGPEGYRLEDGFKLGSQDSYDAEAGDRVEAILDQLLAGTGVEVGGRPFRIPNYMNGGRSRPFGRVGVLKPAANAAAEIQHYDAHIFSMY